MSSQPKIKLKCNSTDYWLEGLSITLLLWSLVYLVYYYPVLPDMIPSHYNLQAKIDGIGHKNYLWFTFLVFIVLYVFMTVINRYPHHFNYLSPITEDNAQNQYSFYTRIIRILKLIVSIIFGLIMFFSIKNALIINSINLQNG